MAIATPTLIGQQAIAATSASTTVTVPAGGVPAGAAVFVVWTANSGGAASGSDSDGNTYSIVSQITSGSRTVALLAAIVTDALESGDTIAVGHGSSFFANRTIQAYYVTADGVLSIGNAAAGVASAFPHTQPAGPDNVTVAGDSAIVVGGFVYNDATDRSWTPATNYTGLSDLHIANAQGFAVYRIVTAAGAYEPEATTSTTGQAWGAVGFAIEEAVAAPQHLAPAADSVDGAWTDQAAGTALAAAIDETTASDTDYIQSETAPASSGCRVKLASGTDPASSTGHVIRWRAGKDPTDGAQINMTVTLRQGGGDVLGAGTLIATFTRTNVGAFTTYDETLSGAEADSITNYGDLYLELYATQV